MRDDPREFSHIISAQNKAEATQKFKTWFSAHCEELKVPRCDLTISKIRSPGTTQKRRDKSIGQVGHEYIFYYREKKTHP